MIGYDDFRPGQEKAATALLHSRRTFKVRMRTSGGSHCGNYVLPTLLLTGVAVIISPLISLMLD